MATSYTSLIGLALPVTGELSGTWGDTVNNYISTYIDSAVAGTQIISGSQTAVTLSVTNGASLSQAGSGATGSAQYTIIRCTGNPASLLTITAPASSKSYIIINATSTSQSVKIVGAGPTTGVTVASGDKALVAWNGSDFVRIGASAGGSDTQVQYNNSGNLAGSANMTFDGTKLTVGNILDSGLTASQAVFTDASKNLVSVATTGTGSVVLGTAPTITLANGSGLPLTSGVSGQLPVANGGTNSNTANGGFNNLSPMTTAGDIIYGGVSGAGTRLGIGSNGYVLTVSSGAPVWAAASGSPGGSTTQVQYNNGGAFAGSANMTFDGTTLTAAGFSGPHNGTVGATTANTGAFTTLSASSTVSGTGFSTYLASPPAIGGTAAAAGAFTTLSASSTVSGTGFSTYLASPPAIGGTAAAAGTFTAGTFTSTVHKGATSGTITLAAPAVAGTQSYTLPTGLPASSGYVLSSTTGGVMSWAAAGSGSPAGTNGQFQYNNSGSFGGASVLTYNATGPIVLTTIGVGATTPSASGSGISFPATQSASSDVNTLDDYEEGTFTPAIGGTATYTAQTGNYTKIGRQVFFSIQLTILVKGTGNNYTITGFPFAATVNIRANAQYWLNTATAISSLAAIGSGGTQIDLASVGAAATSVANNTIFQNSTALYLTGFYES